MISMEREACESEIDCKTNIVLSEEGSGDVHSWNDPNVDSVCGPFRIRFDATDGKAVRFRSQRVCIRDQFNGHVFDNYVCRTDVTKESIGEMECESVKCVKIHRLGKYHNRFEFEMDYSKTDAEKKEGMVEVVPAEGPSRNSTFGGRTLSSCRTDEQEISTGQTNRLGRMVLDRAGNRVGSGKIIKRRRSRRRVCLDKFMLFDRDGNIIGKNSNSGERITALDSRMGIKLTLRNSESQLMRQCWPPTIWT